jgi:hypothetical protein
MGISISKSKAIQIYNEFCVSHFAKNKSYEFKLGVADALRSGVESDENFFSPTVCPYKACTPQRDAWHAGNAYGRKIAGIEG